MTRASLLIDLGNTRLKWAIREGNAIRHRGALAHGGVGLEAALETSWAALPNVRRVWVASVASLALDVEVEAIARRRFRAECEFLRSPAAALGIRNAYRDPERLGIDRFLGLAALHSARARAQVLASVGTALTLDAIDATGVHLGGWILPSPTLMRESIAARAARVGDAPGAVVAFADNTADGLCSGAVNAAIGAIDRFVANAAQRFGAQPAIVLAGGGADDIAPNLSGSERRTDLVLDGLALWADAAQSSDRTGGAG